MPVIAFGERRDSQPSVDANNPVAATVRRLQDRSVLNSEEELALICGERARRPHNLANGLPAAARKALLDYAVSADEDEPLGVEISQQPGAATIHADQRRPPLRDS